jgi:four helix bundle protein
MAGFEELDVWKRAVALSAEVYRTLAQCSDYGFRDQITRSALSIPSNIA